MFVCGKKNELNVEILYEPNNLISVLIFISGCSSPMLCTANLKYIKLNTTQHNWTALDNSSYAREPTMPEMEY